MQGGFWVHHLDLQAACAMHAHQGEITAAPAVVPSVWETMWKNLDDQQQQRSMWTMLM